MTFWPNPVYRNHTAEMRWYFNVAVRETGANAVHVVRYRSAWYDLEGRFLDSKEDHMDIRLDPLQHISYPDLWVTSAVTPFRYQLMIVGRDAQGQEVHGEGTLVCH